MKTTRLFLLPALFAAAAVTTTLRAGEPPKVRLLGHFLKAGDSYRTEMRMNFPEADFSMTVGDRNIEGKLGVDGTEAYVTKVLEAGPKGPSVEEKFCEKDLSKMNFEIMGQHQNEEKKGPMDGTTVVRRRKGETNLWSETLKGGEPTDEQKKHLRENRPDVTPYPDRELNVGESWTVPAETLKQVFGDDMGSLEGKMACKLERIEDLNGESCAVISVDLNATGSGLEGDENGLKMTIHVRGTVYRSLSRDLDLKTSLKGSMKLSGSPTKGLGSTLSAEGPVMIEETATMVK